MQLKERLLEYLKEKFEIITQRELERALAKQERLDITIFVADYGEANGGISMEMRCNADAVLDDRAAMYATEAAFIAQRKIEI